jgi:hypothetical protein
MQESTGHYAESVMVFLVDCINGNTIYYVNNRKNVSFVCRVFSLII